MEITNRLVEEGDAEMASALVQSSFIASTGSSWEPDAIDRFLRANSPVELQNKIVSAAYSGALFSEEEMIAFILMPEPSLIGMLFVHPDRARTGLGAMLWEIARNYIQSEFPSVHSVELNSTPNATRFYLAMGFTPISTEFFREGSRATRMACSLPPRKLETECVLT